jgi:hypothetical protein
MCCAQVTLIMRTLTNFERYQTRSYEATSLMTALFFTQARRLSRRLLPDWDWEVGGDIRVSAIEC